MDNSRRKSPALVRFLASISLDIERWRNGDPYDLSALDSLPSHEQTEVCQVLAERLTEAGDWRDVDALAALGTPAADTLLANCARHANVIVRLRAGWWLADRGTPETLERELLSVLGDRDTDAPIQMTMRLAKEYPRTEVRRALLQCAVDGAHHLRAHAAALALYIAGRAREPFDWTHRPLFLRFGDEDRSVRLGAMEDLRRLISGTDEY
jgi:hypothetical protein